MLEKMKNMSDEEVYDCLCGNKDLAAKAFDELYSRYATKIYTYCSRILLDPELADDVFQETFLRFYESADSKREMTNLGAFLFKIARNLCINEKQRKHHSFLSFEELIYPVRDKGYEKKERVDLLEMALEMLPKRYREVLVLKEFLGMTYKEISDVLGMTLPSVRIKIYRAKQKIREILSPYMNDYQEDNEE